MIHIARRAATLVVLGFLVASCGSDGESGGDGAVSPGRVLPARANWSTGYFQAAIYSELLRELGYDVADEASAELGPDIFYPSLAAGDYDFWANGWFPNHEGDLETEVVGGGTVGDHVTPVGIEVPNGAVQGFLIDKASAEAYGIETLAQIVDDGRLRVLFDRNDDGKADLVGCERSWGCAEIIDATIELHGWADEISHVQDDYDALFADVVDLVEGGRPALFYTWTPNYTVASLEPGIDVVWIGLGAEALQGQDGETELAAGMCTADPCLTGFSPADIRVVANNEFLDANPTAERLFEVVEIPAEAIYAQNLAMRDGAYQQVDIVAAARRWITDNREIVDGWLGAAEGGGS